MKVSLIITTYNWPEALSRVLESVLSQRQLPLEILVADDGSAVETREVVEHFKELADLPVIHCWQEDLGFRAAEIRNRAIARASGDYIVAIDGDMILHPNFIADHHSAAEPGCFAQGSRVIMDKRASEQLFVSERMCPSLWWSGVSNKLNGFRIPFLSQFFFGDGNRLSGIKTCNFAFWRDAAIAINGFNNEYVGWGREDSDFAVRLMNSGVRRRNLKFRAVAYHIFHNENPRDSLEENDIRLERAISQKQVRCQRGLDEHL